MKMQHQTMPRISRVIVYLFIMLSSTAWSQQPNATIGAGQQPQVSTDKAGTVRVVYGRADSIFGSTLKPNGKAFSQPVFVGHIPEMHLGMTRGPQIASSANQSIITAMDQKGTIHFFSLLHATNRWQYKGSINDIPGSAPEGLMSIAADLKDNFYAVWLDIRQDKTNNICFASLPANTTSWTKNRLIYTSPDGHVCECCKPSIDVSGARIAVMYRNWLKGSRDLYLTTSGNGGQSFSEAKKLGLGTWQLNGCPMDGGSVTIDNAGKIVTTWRREGSVYYSLPGRTEIKVATGRTCSMVAHNTSSKKPLITFQDNGNVKLAALGDSKELIVGKGSFITSTRLHTNQILCVWEQDKTIRYKKVSVPSGDVTL